MGGALTAEALLTRHAAAWQAATVGELGWFEEMAARRGVAVDALMHPTSRAYCDFLLALTYSACPAQITAIWALERTYLESWEGARPGAQPYRELVDRCTSDAFRSYLRPPKTRLVWSGLGRIIADSGSRAASRPRAAATRAQPGG
jgi:thiaminase